MSVQTTIEERIRGAMPVVHLEVVNESHMHNVPANSETHFRLVLVSDAFAGQMPVRRHQQIYALLKEEVDGPIHALTMHLFTPQEWQKRQGETADSPACRGGSKQDSEFQA